MRLKDLLLVLTALAGIGVGVFLPGPAGLFTPYVLYMMMTILFLRFFHLDFAALMRFGPGDALAVTVWTAVKLAFLPVAAWALASWLAPDYALAALLLSGVSTGVTAPFFAGMLGADVNRTLRVVVLTSLLAPLSLPALVSLIMGARIEISFFHMARMLLMVIFIPLIAAGAARKIIPGLKAALTRLEYPLALLLFFMINLGVFSSYSEFILGRQDEVLRALAVSFGLAGFYCAVGWLLGRAAAPRLDGLTGAVGLTFINNVLIIVFAARFFGPKCPLLAAAYMIPLFVMLIPLRRLGLQKA